MRQRVSVLIAALGVLALSVVSVLALREPYHGYIWSSTFINGFGRVVPTTAGATLRVGAFWGLATAILALIALRLDPELEFGDALIGGAAGAWIFAYIAGNLLGPVGLFRSYTIWLITIAAIFWLWRHWPEVEIRALSVGQMLALLACLLMAVSKLPLQLGSPLPPYMDVLNTPASAQRIMTFGRYLPFDNDPYGYWSPFIQTPGVELFYAMLGLSTFTHLASVAEMSALTPMCCLIIFGAYRLGRTLMNDVAGGFAALLLFATTTFERAHSMRGTAVTFALIAVGLAFFLDRDRRPIKTAIGILALGTAIASHAIIGTLGLSIAASALLIRCLSGESAKDILAEAACLFGAILVAVPEFAVAMRITLPFPILSLAQFAGGFVIWRAASSLKSKLTDDSLFAMWTAKGLVLILLLLLLWPPSAMAMLRGLGTAFPILFPACVAGLLVLGVSKLDWALGAYVVAGALLIGIAAEYATPLVTFLVQGSGATFGFGDVIYKVAEYWYPYFLIFPAAAAFDVVYHRLSKPFAIALLLVVVIFPIYQRPELDDMYTGHSMVQEWASDWLIAKQGWWGNTGDTRWAQTPAELHLNKVLLEEIRKGRITTATHIVHVTPHTIMWQDVLLFSLYTGIDDDLYVMHPDPMLGKSSTSGSRLWPVSMLPAALAKKPPYIVVHKEPPLWLSLPPAGYNEIFHDDGVRLFRRDDLVPAADSAMR